MVARPTRKPMRSLRAQCSASARCSSTICPTSSERSPVGESAAPKETTPRSPISVRPSTDPRLTPAPRFMCPNMSFTHVTPLETSSMPLRSAPTWAISRSSCTEAGTITAGAQSKSDRVSPIPGISASLRWVWALTKPGTTSPCSSPTTSASGWAERSSSQGPVARMTSPSIATAPSRRSPAGPIESTWPPRTRVTVIGGVLRTGRAGPGSARRGGGGPAVRADGSSPGWRAHPSRRPGPLLT